MTDEQIKHMVNRFLGWKLPADFSPDGGISFDADGAKKLNPRNRRYEPSGTNLFDATQADAMVRHMIEGMPADPLTRRVEELERLTSGLRTYGPIRTQELRLSDREAEELVRGLPRTTSP